MYLLFRFFLLAATIHFAIALYKCYGFPKFTMAYGKQLLPDPMAQLLCLTILQFSAHPYFGAMIPIICHEMNHFVPYVLDKIAIHKPDLAEMITNTCNTYFPKATGMTPEDWQLRVSAREKWNIFYTMVRMIILCL